MLVFLQELNPATEISGTDILHTTDPDLASLSGNQVSQSRNTVAAGSIRKCDHGVLNPFGIGRLLPDVRDIIE